MIRQAGGKWVLYTADGKRRLGTHGSRAGALAQERAIEANKMLADASSNKDPFTQNCDRVSDEMNKRLVKPLRSQPIRYTEGSPNQQQSGIKRKMRSNDGNALDSMVWSGNFDRPGADGGKLTIAMGSRVDVGGHKTAARDLVESWRHDRTNPVVRKAGEIVSGMFPSMRTYPRIPSPNGGREPFAIEPRRVQRKGWMIQGGKRIYVPLPSDFGAGSDLRDAAGRAIVVPKQVTPLLSTGSMRPERIAGLRPRPIDQTVRTGIPSRASVGQEAVQEFLSNPSAMRDPDPWRVPKVQPRAPSPLAKVNTNIRDMSLRMDPKYGTSRGLRQDDVANSIRGQSAPLGETQRTESPAPSNLVDPSKFRKGGRGGK
jgi:hypothetical protein